jgi:hypothetical protein
MKYTADIYSQVKDGYVSKMDTVSSWNIGQYEHYLEQLETL